MRQPREVSLVNRKGLEENGKSMQMKHEEEKKKRLFFFPSVDPTDVASDLICRKARFHCGKPRGRSPYSSSLFFSHEIMFRNHEDLKRES